MSITRTRFAKMIRLTALVIVLITIIGYAALRSIPYFRGPEISIFQPLNGSTISSTTVVVAGRAQRVTSLSMNQNSIQVDENGNFKETLIVFPGVNIISFDVTDQFKRTTHTELKIFGMRGF